MSLLSDKNLSSDLASALNIQTHLNSLGWAQIDPKLNVVCKYLKTDTKYIGWVHVEYDLKKNRLRSIKIIPSKGFIRTLCGWPCYSLESLDKWIQKHVTDKGLFLEEPSWWV